MVELAEPLPETTAESPLPFDEYKLTDSERVELQRGHVDLLKACLARFALTSDFAGDYLQQESPDPDDPFWFQWGGRLGFLSRSQAQQFGYGQPTGGSWVNGSGMYLSSALNLTFVEVGDPLRDARVAAALYGPENVTIPGSDGRMLDPVDLPRDAAGDLPPQGGCFASVEQDIAAPMIDLRPIESEVMTLALGHPATQAVNSTWSDCMAERGFDYSRFDEAILDNAGPRTSANIEVAVADVDCTLESRWPQTYYFVLAEYQRQAIRSQPALFSEAYEAERKRLERLALGG